jgi:hypothetical protein
VVAQAVGASSDVVVIAKMGIAGVGAGILARSGVDLDAVAAAVAVEFVACAQPIGRRSNGKCRPRVHAAASSAAGSPASSAASAKGPRRAASARLTSAAVAAAAPTAPAS